MQEENVATCQRAGGNGNRSPKLVSASSGRTATCFDYSSSKAMAGAPPLIVDMRGMLEEWRLAKYRKAFPPTLSLEELRAVTEADLRNTFGVHSAHDCRKFLGMWNIQFFLFNRCMRDFLLVIISIAVEIFLLNRATLEVLKKTLANGRLAFTDFFLINLSRFFSLELKAKLKCGFHWNYSKIEQDGKIRLRFSAFSWFHF